MLEEFRGWIVETGLFNYLINTKKEKEKKYVKDRYPRFKNDLFFGFDMKKPLSKERVSIRDIIQRNVLSEYKISNLSELKETEYCFLPMTKQYSVIFNTSGIKKFKKEENINDLFYEKYLYREPFDIDIEILDEKLFEFIPKSRETSDEEKFNNIIDKLSKNPNLDNNFLFLLTGEIGSGKTTFLTKLLYELNNSKSVLNGKVAVRIDFEDFALKLITESKKNNISLDDYLDEHIMNTINSEISSFTNKVGISDKKRIFVALFIDNLDVIYQKFCESYFVNSNGFTFIEIFKAMVEKLKEFSFNDNKGIIVFALREESIEAIKNRKIGEDTFFKEYFSAHLKINIPTHLKTKNIIKKRLLLIKKLISNKSNVNKKLLQNIDENLSMFNETRIDFEEIHNISTEGLRNTIDLFYRIAPTVYCKTLFKRFFIDSYYIRKMHFFGDSFEYSQVEKGIFNIFLNNRLYREDLCHSDSHQIYHYKTKEVQKMASMRHFHTYWLKYFILFYLYHDKKEALTKEPSLSQLISFFTIKGSSNKYEENLVRLVLLGLSEVAHGRLLGIRLKEDDKVDAFYLTDRAKYLLENVVWNFNYLSIVLEDVWLQLPNVITKKCRFMLEPITRHCHEIDENVFLKKRKENFETQIKKVWLFVSILDISYKYEKLRVKDVFNELNKKDEDFDEIEDNLFLLPNFVKIRMNLKNEIIERAKELEINHIDSNYFKKIKYSDTYSNKTIEDELESFFKDVYCVKYDNDSSVLEKYFTEHEEEYANIFN